jgi:DNA-binding PadR family transcriptional regulator
VGHYRAYIDTAEAEHRNGVVDKASPLKHIRRSRMNAEVSGVGWNRSTSRLTVPAVPSSKYVHHGYTHPVNTAPESLLPLPSATFHILVALADDDRHGYAILKEVAARTDGTVRLGAGTLYRSIERMLQQGLIREISSRPAKDMDDERRRYYRITPFGRAVARAEARRLAQMLAAARASGLAPRKI